MTSAYQTVEEQRADSARLNLEHGDAGRTFSTLGEAERYASGKPRARVYPLWDGLPEARSRVGYLVSIEPEWKPRKFTGKVRAEP